MVLEVADTSRDFDLEQKRDLYAGVGIPEYWVIDVKGEKLTCFLIAGKDVRERLVLGNTIVSPQTFADLSIDLAELFN